MLNLILRICFWCSRYATIQSFFTRVIRQLQYLQGIGAGAPTGRSGERVLIEKLLSGHSNKLVIFDVGANVGQFSNLLLDALGQQPLEIHAFEPSQLAFDALRASFETCPQVRLNHLALGSSKHKAPLYSDKEGSTMSSLYQRRIVGSGTVFTPSETIDVESLDDYCSLHGITHIDLLKLDVEGHELEVLRGGYRMLAGGNISRVTFEFGGTHIDSRVFLRDFFELFEELGQFQMARITPTGYLLPLPAYHESLEQYQTANYLVEFACGIKHRAPASQ
jgi:FkbM family methyltransferase